MALFSPPPVHLYTQAAHVATLPPNHPALRGPSRTVTLSALKARQAEAGFFTPDLKQIIAAGAQLAHAEVDKKTWAVVGHNKNPDQLKGNCAWAFARAMEKGGIRLEHGDADTMKPKLERAGYVAIAFDPKTYKPLPGDAMVIKTKDHQHVSFYVGHLADKIRKDAQKAKQWLADGWHTINVYDNVAVNANNYTILRNPAIAKQAAALTAQEIAVAYAAEVKSQQAIPGHKPYKVRRFAAVHRPHSPTA